MKILVRGIEDLTETWSRARVHGRASRLHPHAVGNAPQRSTRIRSRPHRRDHAIRALELRVRPRVDEHVEGLRGGVDARHVRREQTDTGRLRTAEAEGEI